MSKPGNRGSLIGLKASLPAVPKAAPVAYTAEMEERILGKDVQMYVQTDIKEPVETEPSRPAPAMGGRQKEPTVLMNAKLPVSLHQRLKRTAQFNDISMTDILIRAIEAELESGGYAAPPEVWGVDR